MLSVFVCPWHRKSTNKNCQLGISSAIRFAKDNRLRLDPRIPCKKTQVGGCGPFWVSIEYFTSAPFTNSYDRGGFFFPTDTGSRSANVAFVFVVSEEEEEEEEEEINLFSMVFFLPHEDDKKRLVVLVVDDDDDDRKRRDSEEDAEVLVLVVAAAGRVVLAIAVATIARAWSFWCVEQSEEGKRF